MKRQKRSARSRNRNTWKHGFYSSVFRPEERRMLDRLTLHDMSPEIELIRVANMRFLEALNSSDSPPDVETQIAAVRAVNLSAQSITSLIRAQALVDLSAHTERLADLVERLDSGTPHFPDTTPVDITRTPPKRRSN